MQEIENVAENQTAELVEPKGPSFIKKVGLGLKERGRKFIVKLKRRPMNIGFFVLIISTIVSLCSLGSWSQLGLQPSYKMEMQGMCVFINILFGILVLMLFMNAFPKRSKKPNYIMYGLLILFMLILIGLDLYLYIMWGINRADDLILYPNNTTYWATIDGYYYDALNGVMAHCVLVALSLVLTVLYPIIGKLLNKINTHVDLESNQLNEEIDTSEEV